MITANVLDSVKLPLRRSSYIRLASTSVSKLPFVVALTRSNTFMMVTIRVVTTTTIVGQDLRDRDLPERSDSRWRRRPWPLR